MRSSISPRLLRRISRLEGSDWPLQGSLCLFCASQSPYTRPSVGSGQQRRPSTRIPSNSRRFSNSHRTRNVGSAVEGARDNAETPSTPTLSSEPSPIARQQPPPLLPYTFQTGFSIFAKRASRPFPPPFISPPTSSFSEPLSTHHRSRLRRRQSDSEQGSEHEDLTGLSSGGLLRGYTNGDDALLATTRYLAVADGVGAWNTKPHGNAALWSRLMLHYFSIAAERYYTRLRRFVEGGRQGEAPEANPVTFLQEAYTATMRATTSSQGANWSGTTTACCAVLVPPRKLLVVNLGDSQCRVLRPREHGFVLKTEEQWHWFDCPRQLGTNSPDTPETNASLSMVELEDDDIVILATDGLPDNLWEHEVVTLCLKALGLPLPKDWAEEVDELRSQQHDPRSAEGVSVAFMEEDEEEPQLGPGREWESFEDHSVKDKDPMTRIASDLVQAAKVIATDPYAESPWMERAIDGGLAAQGGKLDDISVVVGRLRVSK